MKRKPRYETLSRERKANIIEAYNAGATVSEIANLKSMSQAAVIVVLEAGGCKNVQPLSLRQFSWEAEAATA